MVSYDDLGFVVMAACIVVLLLIIRDMNKEIKAANERADTYKYEISSMLHKILLKMGDNYGKRV